MCFSICVCCCGSPVVIGVGQSRDNYLEHDIFAENSNWRTGVRWWSNSQQLFVCLLVCLARYGIFFFPGIFRNIVRNIYIYTYIYIYFKEKRSEILTPAIISLQRETYEEVFVCPLSTCQCDTSLALDHFFVPNSRTWNFDTYYQVLVKFRHALSSIGEISTHSIKYSWNFDTFYQVFVKLRHVLSSTRETSTYGIKHPWKFCTCSFSVREMFWWLLLGGQQTPMSRPWRKQYISRHVEPSVG